jgi:hypothetical protein
MLTPVDDRSGDLPMRTDEECATAIRSPAKVDVITVDRFLRGLSGCTTDMHLRATKQARIMYRRWWRAPKEGVNEDEEDSD